MDTTAPPELLHKLLDHMQAWGELGTPHAHEQQVWDNLHTLVQALGDHELPDGIFGLRSLREVVMAATGATALDTEIAIANALLDAWRRK